MMKQRNRKMIGILTLCCLLLIQEPVFATKAEFNIYNYGPGIQYNTQTFIEKMVINIPSVQSGRQDYTNDELMQFLLNGTYQAYSKSDAENYIPDSILNSFSPNQLRGYSSSLGYQYVLFGRYYQDYIDQPILWRVLTVKNGNALLLSEYILDTRPFDSDSNVWETSDLRNWLNSEFYREAFSSAERGAILDGGSVGKVFILSDAELTNSSYGFNPNKNAQDPYRSASGSMYSYSNGLWNVTESDYTNYYDRTAPNSTNVELVTSSGKIMLAKITRDNVGIRPAVWVNVSKLSFTNGEGGISYPFQ